MGSQMCCPSSLSAQAIQENIKKIIINFCVMVKTSKAASAADDILSLVDEMQQEKEIKQESALLQQALDELHETRTIVTTTHDDLISARRATAEATNKLNNASTTITTAIKDAYSKKITF